MRLLSYNIHKGIGGRDRRYRLARIIRVLEHENPDIICLQEVDRNVRRSDFHDQPVLLAEHFGYQKLFQLNVNIKRGGYGNLILSRWPFARKHQISVTRGRRKARGAQLAVIDTPEGPLHLVHWHLGLAEGERQWQVRQVFKHHLFAENQHYPTLMVGDTNDWRNQLLKSIFQEHGFIQITAPIYRFRSFPAWLPMGSLDKAFARGDVFVREARLVRTSLSREASDHLPLIVDFHLRTTSVETLEHQHRSSSNGGSTISESEAEA